MNDRAKVLKLSKPPSERLTERLNAIFAQWHQHKVLLTLPAACPNQLDNLERARDRAWTIWKPNWVEGLFTYNQTVIYKPGVIFVDKDAWNAQYMAIVEELNTENISVTEIDVKQIPTQGVFYTYRCGAERHLQLVYGCNRDITCYSYLPREKAEFTILSDLQHGIKVKGFFVYGEYRAVYNARRRLRFLLENQQGFLSGKELLEYLKPYCEVYLVDSNNQMLKITGKPAWVDGKGGQRDDFLHYLPQYHKLEVISNLKVIEFNQDRYDPADMINMLVKYDAIDTEEQSERRRTTKGVFRDASTSGKHIL